MPKVVSIKKRKNTQQQRNTSRKTTANHRDELRFGCVHEAMDFASGYQNFLMAEIDETTGHTAFLLEGVLEGLEEVLEGMENLSTRLSKLEKRTA